MVTRDEALVVLSPAYEQAAERERLRAIDEGELQVALDLSGFFLRRRQDARVTLSAEEWKNPPPRRRS